MNLTLTMGGMGHLSPPLPEVFVGNEDNLPLSSPPFLTHTHIHPTQQGPHIARRFFYLKGAGLGLEDTGGQTGTQGKL